MSTKTVHIYSEYYMNTQQQILYTLKSCTQVPTLPKYWIQQIIDNNMKYHKIVEVNSVPPRHCHTHTVQVSEGIMQVEIFGHHLNVSTTPALSVLDKLPKRTSNVRKIEEIDKLALCTGNSDYNMLQLAIFKVAIGIIALSLLFCTLSHRH